MLLDKLKQAFLILYSLSPQRGWAILRCHQRITAKIVAVFSRIADSYMRAELQVILSRL
jgi:hypothetical protein